MPKSETLYFTPEVSIEILKHLGYEVTTEKDYTRVKGEGVYNIPIHRYGPTWATPGVINDIFQTQFNKGVMKGRQEHAEDIKKLLFM